MAYSDDLDRNEQNLRGEALGLYFHVANSGKLHRTLNFLQNKSRKLADLEYSKPETCKQNRHYAGQQSIAIDQIKGTEGREVDFDDAFNPLHDRLRSRWLGVASVRLSGKETAAGRSGPHGRRLLCSRWSPPNFGRQGAGRAICGCGSD